MPTGARVRNPATSSPTRLSPSLDEIVESSLADWDSDKRYGKPPSPVSKTRIPQPAQPSKAKELLQQAVHRYVHPERQIVLPHGLDTRTNCHRAPIALTRGHKQPWSAQQQHAYQNRLTVLREGPEAEGELSQVSSFAPLSPTTVFKEQLKACAGGHVQEIQPDTYSSSLHLYMHSDILALKLFEQEAWHASEIVPYVRMCRGLRQRAAGRSPTCPRLPAWLALAATATVAAAIVRNMLPRNDWTACCSILAEGVWAVDLLAAFTAPLGSTLQARVSAGCKALPLP